MNQNRNLIPSQAKPRMSRLAVIALLLAIVPCCPFVSLLGAALGVIAYQRVKTNNNLAGRRVATGAIFAGVAVAMLSALALSAFVRFVDQTNRDIMTHQILSTLNDPMDGQAARAQRHWHQATGVTADQLEAMAATASDRYGRMQRFNISSTSICGGWLSRKHELAIVFVFERRELTGSAVFEERNEYGMLWPQFRLQSLLIEDREQGELRLPAASASGS